MARSRKKRKTKKGGNNPLIRKFDTKLDLQNNFGEMLVKSIKEDFDLLETDFGPIKISDGAVVYSLKNKGAFVPIASIRDRVSDDDYLEILLEYERLNQEFPGEPFINVQIADCYKHLNEEEKYAQRLKENFSKYKGDPLVDIQYTMNLDQITLEIYESIFDPARTNIHEQYPTFKAFDPYTVTEFYALKTKHHIALKEYEVAQKCVAIVQQIDVKKARLLSAMVLYATDPAFRRKAKWTRFIVTLVVLAIIGGVIWGLITLLRWIF